jgi:hypothetical protein
MPFQGAVRPKENATTKRPTSTPYSRRHVHCAYCPSCNNSNCLESDTARSKCSGAMRRDDLKSHTKTHHTDKNPRAVGDDKQQPIVSFFQTPRPHSAPHILPSESTSEDLAIGATCSTSAESESLTEEIDEFDDSEEKELLFNDSKSESLLTKLNQKIDAIGDQLSAFMSKLKLSETNTNVETNSAGKNSGTFVSLYNNKGIGQGVDVDSLKYR